MSMADEGAAIIEVPHQYWFVSLCFQMFDAVKNALFILL